MELLNELDDYLDELKIGKYLTYTDKALAFSIVVLTIGSAVYYLWPFLMVGIIILIIIVGQG